MGITIHYSTLETSERRIDEMCSFLVSKAKEAGYEYQLVDVEGGWSYSTLVGFYNKKEYKSTMSYLQEVYFRVVELPSYRDLHEAIKREPPFVCSYIAKFTDEENKTERLRRRLDPLIARFIVSDPKFAVVEKRRRFYVYATPWIPPTLKGDLRGRVKGVVIDNGICEPFSFLFLNIGREWFLHDFTKTQPFKNDEVKECVKFHVFICECLRKLREMGGWKWYIHDEGEYYETRNVEVLTYNFGILGSLIHAFASELEKVVKEVFGEDSPEVRIGDYI